jgi:molybdopterin-synthase adenylyltransferase
VSIAMKECVWEKRGEELIIVIDPREALTLDDTSGHIEALLEELSGRPQTVAELERSFRDRGIDLSRESIESGITGLGALGLIEDGERTLFGDPDVDQRHLSNLAFFGAYADLDSSRTDFVRRLRDSHVVVLGVGGGGSAVLQCLAGLGVGRMTLVDRDDVEPRNFARQFVYRHSDIGRSKVARAAEWVREYDPAIEVRPVDRWIAGPGDLRDLVHDADIIAGGIDSAPDAHLWVNEAAVRAGIPLVSGGMGRSLLTYYSVDPGNGPCTQCDRSVRARSADQTTEELARRQRARLNRANRLNAPLAMQIGSLIAYEALRYLTGFEAPQAAGKFVTLDLRAGLMPSWDPFFDDPDCPVCALVPGRPKTPVGAT